MMLFDETFLRKLEALRLAVRRSIAGRREGERPTRRSGGASEFVSYRSYVQGDDFRSIDWNLYGRLGQLYVKEFTREEALPARVFVDTTLSMAPKFDYARRLGAALAWVARRECPVQSLEELEALRLGSPFHVPPLSRGLVLVVSDLWDESLRPSLSRIRAERVVVHVLSPEELEPPFRGKVRLVDAETGERLDRFVGEEEAAAYRRALEEHCEAWKRWCFDREINYVRFSSATPLEEAVLVYLRRAGVLE
ncbi:MAG TPA: DUF58 domain-containing protein [Planctomycetota bacterium]|nr:DUF58 domain-containing protein [Planctomycetota bacterium]